MSVIKFILFSTILLFFVIPNVACIRLSHKLMLSLWQHNPVLAEQMSKLSLSRLISW